MITNFWDKFRETFPVDYPEPPLFHSKLWNYSLRFDLGGGGHSHVIRFEQAMYRCMNLLQLIFSESTEIYSIIRSNCDKGFTEGHPQGINDLLSMGFILPREEEYEIYRKERLSDEALNTLECQEVNYTLPVTVKGNNMKLLLWSVLGAELGIRPAASISCYFVDFDNRAIFYPYDDRGADLVSMNKDILKTVYSTYQGWLLDHGAPSVC